MFSAVVLCKVQPKLGRAGLISISHFTTIFAYFWRVKELKNQKQDEAGFISHIKIDR